MTSRLNESLKKIQIEMLKSFIDVCDKLKLRYYVIGGTLLGAVRHEGFIPWDDDIDVGMPRQDYEIFIRKGQQYLEEKYFIQNNFTDLEYPNNFSKIRNCNTTFIETSIKNLNVNHGVYIDIFPIDGTPNSKIEKLIFKIKNSLYITRIIQIYFYKERKKCSYKYKILKCISKIVLPSIKITTVKRDKLLKKYNFESSNIVANYCGAWGEKEIMPKEYFGNPVIGMFEGIKVNMPSQYDKYLRQLYGDYMTLPPIEKRKSHHFTEKIDLTKSYLEYRKGK